MGQQAYQSLLVAHICFGSIGLVAFWVAMALPKGGAQHRRAGTVFVRTMAASAAVSIVLSAMVLIEPSVRPGAERSFFTGLLVAGGVTLALLHRGVRAVRRRRSDPRRWLVRHLCGVLGASVIAHTAFFVSFVPRVLLPEVYERSPELNLAPWVLPPVVGTLLTILACSHYTRRFSLQ